MTSGVWVNRVRMSLPVSVYTNGAVALGYGAFVLLLAFRGARSWLNAVLVVAALATAAWAMAMAFVESGAWPPWSAHLSGPLRDGAWYAVVLAVLYPAGRDRSVWFALAASAAGIVLIDAIFAATGFNAGSFIGIRLDAAATGFATVLFGLVLIENMVRNLTSDQFWSAKYLAVGLFCILIFQLCLRVPEFLTHKPVP